MSREFVKKLSDEELIPMVQEIFTHIEQVLDYDRHEQFSCDTVVMQIQTTISDGVVAESIKLEETIYIEDFSISALDFDSNINDSVKWRGLMYEKFGNEYAKEALFTLFVND